MYYLDILGCYRVSNVFGVTYAPQRPKGNYIGRSRYTLIFRYLLGCLEEPLSAPTTGCFGPWYGVYMRILDGLAKLSQLSMKVDLGSNRTVLTLHHNYTPPN